MKKGQLTKEDTNIKWYVFHIVYFLFSSNYNLLKLNIQRISGDVKITLVVGQRKFLGVGPSLQLARHDAAARYAC